MTLTTTRHRTRLHWVPAAAGWILGVIATAALLSSVSPLIRHLTSVPRQFIDDYLFNFPDTSFAWAFALAVMAGALAARKRIAWWVLVAILAVAVGFDVVSLTEDAGTRFERAGEYLGLGFHITAIAVLVLARGEFWARVRRGALLKAAAVLVAGNLVGILLAWGLLELFPGSLEPGYRLAYAVNRVSGFATATSDLFAGRPPTILNALFGLFGALALMAAAVVLFQSQRADNALTGEDELAIRALLNTYGKNDSLGYFATRRDKSVIFAPDGRAAITYRVEVGVCLASGDPVGDPRGWPQAITAWLALCEAYGWAPGVMGASATAAQAFNAAGLSALQLGDEAILYPDRFRLSGPEMKPVRQAVTRARRSGLTVRLRRHRELSAAEMAEVIKRADTWRDTETERGFSMALGRLGDNADGDCLLVEALDGGEGTDGPVVGMLSFVPWGGNGLSLDLMRRSPQSPERHGRVDGQRTAAARRHDRREPGLTELRDVPLRVRAGIAVGRRSGGAAVAGLAGVLLALVAVGDAVPVEHEVPAGVGAALCVLRGRPAHSAGRSRLGDRRGIPGAAVLPPQQAAHRSALRGAAQHA